MSTHFIDTLYRKKPVRVVMGYDRILNYFHLKIQHLDMKNVPGDRLPIIYSSASDPNMFSFEVEDCREILKRRRIKVPQSMLKAVYDDGVKRVGNYAVQHFADGSKKVLLPKQRNRRR